MSVLPVTEARILIAARTLANASTAARACREAELPYFVSCALLEMESGGRNVYGHDEGGALSGFPYEVNAHNYRVFRWLVIDQKHRSNGVGPCQITYSGYFPLMEKQGLRPWDVHDNMLFGFRILKGNHTRVGSWTTAGAMYNGGPRPSPDALSYGRRFGTKVDEWKDRLNIR